MIHSFEAGLPACPVACRYCFITEHDARRKVWNTNPRVGLNKASTFLNVTPWIGESPEEQQLFYSFPWEILTGDFVGFTAITDPFWPLLDKYLWHFLEHAASVAKLVTCVTKWPIKRGVMERLSRIPNFHLVVTITGNESIEKVSIRKHLTVLALAKECGVPTLPICHPYISGVSDLSFLPELRELGYEHFDVKGLRYCDAQMAGWMPEASRHWYVGHEDEEILPEDGWRQLVGEAGLNLLPPRLWYARESQGLGPHLTHEQATLYVDEVLKLANIVSSDQNEAVIAAAIARRL